VFFVFDRFADVFSRAQVSLCLEVCTYATIYGGTEYSPMRILDGEGEEMRVFIFCILR
jgi:hypothetical protein